MIQYAQMFFMIYLEFYLWNNSLQNVQVYSKNQYIWDSLMTKYVFDLLQMNLKAMIISPILYAAYIGQKSGWMLKTFTYWT